jgi:hypothetical protein
MRDFTWNYFSMTGDVDAYLLYKEMNAEQPGEEDLEEDSLEVWDEE